MSKECCSVLFWGTLNEKNELSFSTCLNFYVGKDETDDDTSEVTEGADETGSKVAESEAKNPDDGTTYRAGTIGNLAIWLTIDAHLAKRRLKNSGFISSLL